MAKYTLQLARLKSATKYQFFIKAKFYKDITVTNRKKPRWKRMPIDQLPPEIKVMADWLNDKDRPGIWGYSVLWTAYLDPRTTVARWLVRVWNPCFFIEDPDVAFEFKMRWFNAPERREPIQILGS